MPSNTLIVPLSGSVIEKVKNVQEEMTYQQGFFNLLGFHGIVFHRIYYPKYVRGLELFVLYSCKFVDVHSALINGPSAGFWLVPAIH